jgi:hypothetical protein
MESSSEKAALTVFANTYCMVSNLWAKWWDSNCYGIASDSVPVIIFDRVFLRFKQRKTSSKLEQIRLKLIQPSKPNPRSIPEDVRYSGIFISYLFVFII